MHGSSYVTMKAALACLMLAATSSSGYKLNNYFSEQELILRVNNAAENTWVAGKNSIFDNMTIDEIRGMLGTIVSRDPPLESAANDANYDAVIATLPREFDARQKWGKCIHPIRAQLKCGSCWSFGASEALSDRFCIAGTDVILSPQYLVSCDFTDGGCSGGRLSSAWRFMQKYGIATDECVTYVSGNGTSPKCMHECANGGPLVLYRTKSSYSIVNFFDNRVRAMEKIMAEIYLNGPIEAGYTVYQDFTSYKSGVYRHREGNEIGGHAVKIIGWGDDPVGGPYWLVANSWDASWGEEGYFRIARGTNECGIERDVWAGIPDVTRVYNEGDP